MLHVTKIISKDYGKECKKKKLILVQSLWERGNMIHWGNSDMTYSVSCKDEFSVYIMRQGGDSVCMTEVGKTRYNTDQIQHKK